MADLHLIFTLTGVLYEFLDFVVFLDYEVDVPFRNAYMRHLVFFV